MRTRRYVLPTVASAALLIIAMTSCKGRTAENMVPSGDTVEVNIDSTEIIVTEAPDSVDTQAPDESLSDIPVPMPRDVRR